jgi:hypothetical protein
MTEIKIRRKCTECEGTGIRMTEEEAKAITPRYLSWRVTILCDACGGSGLEEAWVSLAWLEAVFAELCDKHKKELDGGYKLIAKPYPDLNDEGCS